MAHGAQATGCCFTFAYLQPDLGYGGGDGSGCDHGRSCGTVGGDGCDDGDGWCGLAAEAVAAIPAACVVHFCGSDHDPKRFAIRIPCVGAQGVALLAPAVVPGTSASRPSALLAEST